MKRAVLIFIALIMFCPVFCAGAAADYTGVLSKDIVETWEEYDRQILPLIAAIPERDIWLYSVKGGNGLNGGTLLVAEGRAAMYTWDINWASDIRLHVGNFLSGDKDELAVIMNDNGWYRLSVVRAFGDGFGENPNEGMHYMPFKEYAFDEYVSCERLRNNMSFGKVFYDNDKAYISVNFYGQEQIREIELEEQQIIGNMWNAEIMPPPYDSDKMTYEPNNFIIREIKINGDKIELELDIIVMSRHFNENEFFQDWLLIPAGVLKARLTTDIVDPNSSGLHDAYFVGDPNNNYLYLENVRFSADPVNHIIVPPSIIIPAVSPTRDAAPPTNDKLAGTFTVFCAAGLMVKIIKRKYSGVNYL